MALKIYNTLTRKKEDFKPIKKGEVGFYQCGPTVYWTQHLGNIRAMVMADVIVRTLKYLDREGKTPQEIADKYIKIFENDVHNVNTLPTTVSTRATESVKEIIKMVETLLDKRFAYKTDLAIYFDVSKAKDYTRL